MQIQTYVSKFILLCAVVMLSACSYFDTGEPVVSNGDSVDLMTNTSGYEPSGEMSLHDVILDKTDGRVEIYDLDAPPPDDLPTYVPSQQPSIQPYVSQYAAPPAQIEPPTRLQPLGADPSVETYSSSESADYPPLEPPAQVSSMSEPGPQPEINDGLVTVYFDYGSSSLTPDDLDIIQLLTQRFDPTRGVGLDIMGHASAQSEIEDPVERKLANLKESMDRAYAVASALIKNGIPSEALRVSGWGDLRPPTQASGVSGGMDPEAAARRVEIFSQALQ